MAALITVGGMLAACSPPPDSRSYDGDYRTDRTLEQALDYYLISLPDCASDVRYLDANYRGLSETLLLTADGSQRCVDEFASQIGLSQDSLVESDTLPIETPDGVDWPLGSGSGPFLTATTVVQNKAVDRIVQLRIAVKIMDDSARFYVLATLWQ